MSLDVKYDYPLSAHNTLAIDCIADTFITINSVADIAEARRKDNCASCLVLGGGSNLLFDQSRIKIPVLWVNLRGIERQDEQEHEVIVRAMAGENWHEFVSWCLQQDYGGLENLSLIPGNVGAAPVQNIGAYGVEVKDVLHQVEALNIRNGEIRHFSHSECKFSYRDSFFKSVEKGQWIILSVSFRLSRKHHQLRLDYGAIRQTLQSSGITEPTIQDVSHAVIDIRQHRLPDPAKVPNAGSFFKNPVISEQTFKQLKSTNPDIPHYEMDDSKVKIPAGWLIEQCGWKGERRQGCAVHEQHALVLINHDHASGDEILRLAKDIQQSVLQRFNLQLSLEVNRSSDTVFTQD